MKIQRAVITAAGPDQNRLPLQRFVDLNGQEKSALQIVLEEVVAADDRPILLSPALAELAQRERYLALEVDGTRFNIGVKYGVLITQLALALNGDDREEILAKLVELLAGRRQPS